MSESNKLQPVIQSASFDIEDIEILKSKALNYAKTGDNDHLYSLLNSHENLKYVTDWIGDSLLSISCWHNQFTTAIMLIDKFDLDVNHRNHQKTTPLHRACSQDNTAIAMVLINKGANVHLRDNSGKVCVDCGNETTKEIIIEKINILKTISAGLQSQLEVMKHSIALLHNSI